MTIRRFGIALSILVLGYGCAEGASLKNGASGNTGGSSTAAGGESSDAGSPSTSGGGGGDGNGGASSTKTATATGGTAGTSGTTTAGGNTGTTTTTAVTPASCGTASGTLTMVHAAQAGGSGYTGTTTLTPGTATTFNADAVQLKICFSTIGEVPAALTAANMKIYHASADAGTSGYTELTTTPISLEKPETSRFCFIFDLSKLPAAAGLAITGTATLKFNWSFDSTQVTGLSLDTREGHKPELIAVYDAAVAACTNL